MQINVEKLPECRASLRVEIPAEKVASERQKLVKDYAKQAKLPGYRPGKVPASVIEARFKKKIDEEFESRIIGQAIREAREQEDLQIISVTKIDEKNYHVDGTFSFAAELTLAPEFELPNYKNIPVKVAEAVVASDDVDKALEQVREQFAAYEDIGDRGAEMGDFIVVNYTGSIGDQRVGEIAPDVPAQLAMAEDKWFKMDEATFLEGFCGGLVGARPAESREVSVTVPANFPHAELAGRDVTYSVKLNGLKQQVLPELDDALAEKIKPDTTMDELRELMEADLLKQRRGQIDSVTTQQIFNYLNTNIDFELPKDLVMREAQGRVNDIVRENAQRGLGDDAIAEHQEEIISSATTSAHMSVKNSFILEQIAKAEGLEVDNDELREHVKRMAENYAVPYKKLAKQLEADGEVNRIHQQLLMSKTLDFLKSNASVEILTLEELKAAEVAR